jgi:TPR repeat protein
MPLPLRTWLSLFVCLLACDLCVAGLDEGLAALAKRDYATAARELRPLAERGDAEAQYRIGLMYEFGRGYSVDKAQGIGWLRKAAAQGHASAQQELGVIYATGDGVAKDDAQAVAWFQKAAELGNSAAQYNLGLMVAKGAGVRQDTAQALAWFRKSAAQGFAEAQFKVGVAYEHGESVAKDLALAYASYAIAARGGNPEYIAQRDAIARQLSPAQAKQALEVANAWTVGQAMPTSLVAASTGSAPPKDRCLASGQLGGERFTATHCAVSMLHDQRSIAIWFNEGPLSAQEIDGFQMSSHADSSKGGNERTMMILSFCPGGGGATASPAAVKMIDVNTNHAKSVLAGIQWVLEAPDEFKVDKMTGEVKPGALLSGKLTGKRGGTSFTADFDINCLPRMPAQDWSAGSSHVLAISSLGAAPGSGKACSRARSRRSSLPPSPQAQRRTRRPWP